MRPTRRNRQIEDLTVPVCVGNYNRNMGGVDRLDQLRSYYGVGRAGRRWWKYLFWGVLNVGLINAYIMWVSANRPLPANARLFALKAFKIALVHNLCDGHTSRVHRVAPAVDNLIVERVVTDNIVDGHPLAKFAGRKRGCSWCAKTKLRTAKGGTVETSFGCSACKVYLCRTGRCFYDYHA